MSDALVYKENDLTITMTNNQMIINRDGQTVAVTDDEFERCQLWIVDQTKDILNDMLNGEKYANGSTKINKKCPKCDASYLLHKDGLLTCNTYGCNYTKSVDITERR